MNIVECRDVVDDDHRGPGNGGLHCRLDLPEFRKRRRIGIAVSKRCDLDVVERKVPLTPSLSPALDQRLFLFEIDHSFLVIGFALVPNRSSNRKTDDRMNHAVVEHRRVLIATKRGQLIREAWTRGEQLLAAGRGLGLEQPFLKCFDVFPKSFLVRRRSRGSTHDGLIDSLQSIDALEPHGWDPGLDPRAAPRGIH